MDVQTVLQELELLDTERTKKVYMQQGAHEPLFGVATGAMKPITRKIKTKELWTCSGAKPNEVSLWRLMKSKRRWIKAGWDSSGKMSGVRESLKGAACL